MKLCFCHHFIQFLFENVIHQSVPVNLETTLYLMSVSLCILFEILSMRPEENHKVYWYRNRKE